MRYLAVMVCTFTLAVAILGVAAIPSPIDRATARILAKLAEQEEELLMHMVLPDGRLTTGHWTWGRDESGKRTVTVRWETE